MKPLGACIFAMLLSYPAAAAPMRGCFSDGPSLVRQLAELYGEHLSPLHSGEIVTAEDWWLATYASPTTGTWTVVSHKANGSACVIHSGTG